MARHLPLLCLAVVVVAAAVPAHAIFHFDFRTDMMSPFDSGYSRHDVWRRGALASNARVAKQADALGKSLGKPKAAAVAGDISESYAAAGNVNHWMSVSIGTPPQPAKLIIDTGSPVIWAQCASSLGPKVKQQADPIYDQAKSSSYKAFPCSDKLCQGQGDGVINCTKDNKCSYSVRYTILSSEGDFATDTFTFGKKRSVAAPLAFGCGNVALASASGPDLEGESGTMSLAWRLEQPLPDQPAVRAQILLLLHPVRRAQDEPAAVREDGRPGKVQAGRQRPGPDGEPHQESRERDPLLRGHGGDLGRGEEARRAGGEPGAGRRRRRRHDRRLGAHAGVLRRAGVQRAEEGGAGGREAAAGEEQGAGVQGVLRAAQGDAHGEGSRAAAAAALRRWRRDGGAPGQLLPGAQPRAHVPRRDSHAGGLLPQPQHDQQWHAAELARALRREEPQDVLRANPM